MTLPFLPEQCLWKVKERVHIMASGILNGYMLWLEMAIIWKSVIISITNVNVFHLGKTSHVRDYCSLKKIKQEIWGSCVSPGILFFFNECFIYKVQILVSCTATKQLGLPQTDQNGIFPLGSVDYPNICFVVRSTLYVNMMLISFIQKSWINANDLTS